MNYSMKSSAEARNIFNKETSNSKKTLSQFKFDAQAMRKALMQDFKEYEHHCNELKNTYVKSKYEPMVADLTKAYKDKVKNKTEELRSRLDEIFAEKENRLSEYVTSAPTDEQLRLLQTFALRSDISDNELKMLIGKVGNNYQALASVKALAEKQGYTLMLPLNVDEELREMEYAKRLFNNALDELSENDLSVSGMAFYDYPLEHDNMTNDICNKYDNLQAFATVEPELTPLQKIDKAIAEDEKNGDEIGAFKKGIFKNRYFDVLETAEEKQDRINNEVDNVIGASER